MLTQGVEMFGYTHPESLVSTQWITDHLADTPVRFVEVIWGDSDAWGTAAYRSGHIPGSVAWDFATELQDPARNDIAGQAGLAARRETRADGSFRAWRVPTVHEDGTFKPVKELRALFHDLGITAERAIITYCVRGGLSTHAWFVLTQLLGYPDVSEYERSWAEWGNAADLPIEGGERHDLP